MKKYTGLVIVSAMIVVGGCQKGVIKDEPINDLPSENAITYNCQDEIVKVDFFNDKEPQIAQLFFTERNNKNISLPIVPAGSGAKYSDGEVSFWTHQGEATLSMEEPLASIGCIIKKDAMQKEAIDNYGNTVPENCQNWFDGCNSCKIGEGDKSMACTKKFCAPESIEKAHCLD